MKNKPLLLKGISCALLYLISHLLIIYTQYILNFSLYSALLLGIFCGVSMALVSYSVTVKRTIIAIFTGILSAVIVDFILSMSGIPYKLIMYIYRNDEVIREIGHLTVNEVIGYNWGRLFFFWPGLLSTLIITIVLVLIAVNKKNRAK